MVDRVRITIEVDIKDFNKFYKSQLDGHGVLRWLRSEFVENDSYVCLGRGAETPVPIKHYGIEVRTDYKE